MLLSEDKVRYLVVADAPVPGHAWLLLTTVHSEVAPWTRSYWTKPGSWNIFFFFYRCSCETWVIPDHISHVLQHLIKMIK